MSSVICLWLWTLYAVLGGTPVGQHAPVDHPTAVGDTSAPLGNLDDNTPSLPRPGPGRGSLLDIYNGF